jgi:IclR family transcriptional regulator, acetate operon repressor
MKTDPPDAVPEKPANGTRIQSVSRGCRLLMWIANRPHGATAKEAAFATRIAVPTTYHLLNTLVDEGFLAKDRHRRYTLGRSAALLAQAYLRGSAVPEFLLTALRQVADLTGETAYLVDWGEHDIRVLASVESRNIVRVAEVAAGPYEAAHARANGKVLLAHAWPEVREAYLKQHPLERRSDSTICDLAQFEAELEAIRLRGYAFDLEEFSPGVCCVAAPIHEGGTVIAALGISVPADRFAKAEASLTRDLLTTIGEIETASAVEHAEAPAS